MKLLSQILDLKKLLLTHFPYLIFFWLFDKAAECYRTASGDLLGKWMAAVAELGPAIRRDPLPSLHPRDLLCGSLGAAAIAIAVYWKRKNAKKFRQGVEYGSARWSAYS